MKSLKQTIILLVLSAITAGILAGFHKPLVIPELIEWVTAKEIEDWDKPIIWIDARTREDYDQGHITDAILINEDEWDELLMDLIEVWSPDQPVVVYSQPGRCKSGQQVAQRLRDELEIDLVYILKGDWQNYSELEAPTQPKSNDISRESGIGDNPGAMPVDFQKLGDEGDRS